MAGGGVTLVLLIFVLILAGLEVVEVGGWNNGAALTPPMGFANWNLFGCNYNDSTFREMSDAMVASGLAARGYEYMLIQECIVPAGHRDPVTHVLQPDPVKFPFGIAGLVDYIHSKGLKAGIYTDVSYLTCAGYEGSGPSPSNPAGHWTLDALTFAQWGLDMIEADFCYSSDNISAFEYYSLARDAIANATSATGQLITFYQCNWGEQDPWVWGPQTANLFRNTRDICSPGSIEFSNILFNFDNTISHSSWPPQFPGAPGTGIGAWNDPDMLGVGLPGITDTEGRSQFSLWCILAAPLMLGTDVRNMSSTTYETISNEAAISINQDVLGVQGYAASSPVITLNGGYMLNVSVSSAGGSTLPGGAWNMSQNGFISNLAEPSMCVTIMDCGEASGSVVFAYECVNDSSCTNQNWSYNSSTGSIVSLITPHTPMCLAAVSPLSSPYSQLVIVSCNVSDPSQKWAWSPSDNSLCLPGLEQHPTAWSGSANESSLLCLTFNGLVNLYAKPLASSVRVDKAFMALAVLNRGLSGVTRGYEVDFGQFDIVGEQAVYVFDVWEDSASGPHVGGYVTRPLDPHETVLLLLSFSDSF